MRLHTDHLSPRDLYTAAWAAGAEVEEITTHGSRSRDHGLSVHLSGDAPYRPNRHHDGDVHAATWDQWGVFFGILFERDPRMIAGGPKGYVGAEDYRWQTGDRFLTADDESATGYTHRVPAMHRVHRWEFGGESITGAYAIHGCRGCPAIRRFLIGALTREDIGLGVPPRTLADLFASDHQGLLTD
jgi:hypothetical protein